MIELESEAAARDRLEVGLARALGVAVDAAIRDYVTTGKGALPGEASLLHWDTLSVHGYVFDTTNPSVVRGASGLLRELDDALRAGTLPGLEATQILYAGAGSGLAVITSARAEAVIAELHGLFARRTRVATVGAVAVRLGQGGEPFSESAQRARRQLARERGLRAPDVEASVPFFADRCAICGRRAAAYRPTRASAPAGRLECAPCRERIEAAKRLLAQGGETEDLDRLADAEGFYAVLYLDGNGIGRTVRSLESPLQYTRFSQALATLLRAGFEAVAHRFGLREEGTGGDRPGATYQLPVCGGDDLVAILPADVAVPVARDLLAHLERMADASEIFRQHRIGASAGIALARSGFPVRHLLLEAEALLELAKQRVYRQGQPEPVRSAVAWGLVLDGSPRAESLELARFAAEPPALLRSGLPYSLPELGLFSQRLQTLRAAAPEVGRSQLHALLRFGQAGPHQLRNHALYQIARHPAWQALVRSWAGLAEGAPLSADAAFAAIVPRYGERSIFDLPDVLPLLDHWREPASEEVTR
jgi:hypothetical protein